MSVLEKTSVVSTTATVDSPLQKVHGSKPICMHYSNTGLKIASFFLPHSYLCPPPISLSHFKSDRGSLDRLTLTQALYIDREQSKWLKLVSAAKSHHGMSFAA